MASIVRALRLLEYEGPRDWVEEQINRRSVKGQFAVGRGCFIREGLVGDTLIILPDTEQLRELLRESEARVKFLLDKYHLWGEEGTFTFPDGDTWKKE